MNVPTICASSHQTVSASLVQTRLTQRAPAGGAMSDACSKAQLSCSSPACTVSASSRSVPFSPIQRRREERFAPPRVRMEARTERNAGPTSIRSVAIVMGAEPGVTRSELLPAK